MIILEPMGGLANRMRVIASGIWLKEKLNTELVVIWNENYELNCSYHLIFEESSLFRIIKKPRKYNYVKTSNQTGRVKSVATTLVNKLTGIDFCIQEPDFYNLIWTGKLDIYQAAKKNKITYIQTCQEFGDNLYAFQYFKPIETVSDNISRITKQFDRFTVGVHIRRMDHNNSIQYSPTELFTDRMNQLLAAEKQTTFFLCTDDGNLEKELITLYGEKVITYPKELSRNSVAGIQDAAVDMFCLSKTSKILGSYWSSFSDIASRLNHAGLEVLKTSG